MERRWRCFFALVSELEASQLGECLVQLLADALVFLLLSQELILGSHAL